MSKTIWKILGLSGVVIIILVLIGINYIQGIRENAEQIIGEVERGKEISDEFLMDAQQVFDILERAHSEQRQLTVEEQTVVDEFKAKYDAMEDSLTTSESLVKSNILLMSIETVPSSTLESESGRYEEYRQEVLRYLSDK